MNDSGLKNKFKQASDRLKQAIKEYLEDVAQMQKDMAEDFAITNVIERLKEFKIYPVKRKRRTYPPYRERLHGRRTGFNRKPYWHRTRSNPQRRRKHH